MKGLPGWLTYSGRFTHIPSSAGRAHNAGQGKFAGERSTFYLMPLIHKKCNNYISYDKLTMNAVPIILDWSHNITGEYSGGRAGGGCIPLSPSGSAAAPLHVSTMICNHEHISLELYDHEFQTTPPSMIDHQQKKKVKSQIVKFIQSYACFHFLVHHVLHTYIAYITCPKCPMPTLTFLA